MNKIYLGNGANGEGQLYLEEHKFDCGWYWAFGYIGNRSLHMHISALIEHPEKYDPAWTNVSRQFKSTWLTQGQWWILRDLFISAYALKKAVEVYLHGGHQTEAASAFRVLNSERAAEINGDLKTLLDCIWTLLTEWAEQS